MTRHLLDLLGSPVLIAACVPAAPAKFVRARPAEPPKLEVLIEPETVPAFQQTLKPLPTDGDGEPEVQGLDAIEAAHADRRPRRLPSWSRSRRTASILLPIVGAAALFAGGHCRTLYRYFRPILALRDQG